MHCSSRLGLRVGNKKPTHIKRYGGSCKNWRIKSNILIAYTQLDTGIKLFFKLSHSHIDQDLRLENISKLETIKTARRPQSLAYQY